MIALVP